MEKSEALINRYGGERLASRQIDELIGIARGLCADGMLNQSEVEFLQRWLAANVDIASQPVIRTLFERVNDVLADGVADREECADLFSTLSALGSNDFELGEVLKPSTLPLCSPAPRLSFRGHSYCFTGTFSYGRRSQCEAAVTSRGAEAGSLSKRTSVLVIGAYVTDAWKHSTFGNKIIKAMAMREAGIPISIVTEAHWSIHL